jgi:hypothetical protein
MEGRAMTTTSPVSSEPGLGAATGSAPRDYVAELRKYVEGLPADHDQLRTMEKLARFCNGAVEKMRSDKTEGYFNEFLEHN